MSAISPALAELPDHLTTGLPRWPIVPAVLTGRLAVATGSHGQQLWRALLAPAVEYIATSNIGAFALVVEAKDDAAQRFYRRRHGFVEIKGEPPRLALPLATALQALAP